MARHVTHIELLLFKKLETYDAWRWLEYTALRIESFDLFGISFVSSLGGRIYHKGQYIIIGADRKKQMKEKERLNVEWVKEHEPDTFLLPSWQEIYKKLRNAKDKETDM
ncbi:hypothetical protein [Prevotella sp. KH2C16]|uniref:hypothetical protein n=1 Tax=Prevotella sp. KH2C16 TaxID=1855325 RepID=UPI0008ECF925|nr:hypothetical protein [Prevotella sp. KH2C16]SFG27697.1 hypothetical protein SAMN05216383_108117 [Prevotella sp. KH2C16]